MRERKATMTVDEAARYLGIGRGTAYEAIRRGELPAVRLGRRLLVPTAALERMLDEACSKSESEPHTTLEPRGR